MEISPNLVMKKNLTQIRGYGDFFKKLASQLQNSNRLLVFCKVNFELSSFVEKYGNRHQMCFKITNQQTPKIVTEFLDIDCAPTCRARLAKLELNIFVRP